MTNTQGKAVLTFRVTALDWTKGGETPARRDWVSGREYIVKLRTPNAEEELRVVMKPGAVSKGKRYTVRIERMSKPRYVQTE